MAQVMRTVDDLTGEPNAVTVRFALDGRLMEIDLCGLNAERLRRILAPYIAKARRVRRADVRPVRRRSDVGDIRQWAADHGHKVRSRGRVPREVVDAYDQRDATLAAPVEPVTAAGAVDPLAYDPKVREWAIKHGLKVKEQGRMSAEVVAAYRNRGSAARRRQPVTVAPSFSG